MKYMGEYFGWETSSNVYQYGSPRSLIKIVDSRVFHVLQLEQLGLSVVNRESGSINEIDGYSCMFVTNRTSRIVIAGQHLMLSKIGKSDT